MDIKIHACRYFYVYGAHKTFASSHFSKKKERIANVFVDFESVKHGKIDARLICRVNSFFTALTIPFCLSVPGLPHSPVPLQPSPEVPG